jgi:hypothetical protein
VLLLAAGVVAAILPGGQLGADEEKVVVSRPGTVFHRAGSSDIRGQGVEKGLDAAMAAGYQPCRVCYAKQAPASNLLGTSGGATVSGSSSGGGGRPSPPASAQPQGLQFGTLSHKSLDGESKDPYEDLRTIRTASKEQGAYGEEFEYPRHGGYY